MGAAIEKKEVRKLNKAKLADRKHTIMSTEEALKEVTPIEWKDDIIRGDNKVIINK